MMLTDVYFMHFHSGPKWYNISSYDLTALNLDLYKPIGFIGKNFVMGRL